MLKNTIRTSIASVVLTLVLYGSDAFAQSTVSYQNPISVQFGDPYVLHHNDKYYMYGTGGGAKNGFAAYSSSDLVNWTYEGDAFSARPDWVADDAGLWAPEIQYFNG